MVNEDEYIKEEKARRLDLSGLGCMLLMLRGSRENEFHCCGNSESVAALTPTTIAAIFASSLYAF